jgi:hypothetical protein
VQSACVFGALHSAWHPRGKYVFVGLGERRLELGRRAIGLELVATALVEGQAMSLDAA